MESITAGDDCSRREGKLKLVYVTSSYPFGSGETFIGPEIAELAQRGHRVMVVPMHPRGPLAQPVPFGVEVRAEPLLSAAVLVSALGWRVSASILFLLTCARPLVAMKNLAVLPKGLWLATLARRWEADHIHAHWAATTATMAMIASEVSGIPWSFTAHRWDIVENNLLAEKCRRAAFVRFISKSGLELAQRQGVDSGTKARVLHMGVRLPKGIRQPAEGKQHFTVLCPANLIPVKGHIYLIGAMAHIKEKGKSVRLWLAGDGPLRPELEAKVEILGLSSNVRFLGQLPHTELLALYEKGEVDAVVLPSVDLGNGLHEGIPVALMEAMAFGVPVVSTHTGGIPELLGDGAGVLVHPQDAQALADALEQLACNPELRMQLREAGRKRVLEGFAIDKVVDKLEECFKATVGSKSS